MSFFLLFVEMSQFIIPTYIFYRIRSDALFIAYDRRSRNSFCSKASKLLALISSGNRSGILIKEEGECIREGICDKEMGRTI